MTDTLLVNETRGTVTLPIDAYNALLQNMQVAIPLVTLEKFSDLSGLSNRGREGSKHQYGVVEGLRRNGYLPTVKLGRHVMVNLFALQEELSEKDRI